MTLESPGPERMRRRKSVLPRFFAMETMDAGESD